MGLACSFRLFSFWVYGLVFPSFCFCYHLPAISQINLESLTTHNQLSPNRELGRDCSPVNHLMEDIMTQSQSFIDQAKPIREGEQLDIQRLQKFLQETLEVSDTLEVSQFPRGFSNLTYLLRLGERELVLRRPPFGANVRGGHDMGREYRVLTHLHPVYPRVPRPLAYCEDESILGAPFYVMERVRGIILRDRPPKGMALTPGLMGRISKAFVENLAELHSLDIYSTALNELGKPEGYVQRQVEGWTKRYHNARTDNVSAIEDTALWLAENQPDRAAARTSLIHNDYKYDNLVLSPDDPGQIIAVLDWEMATIGDPLMDLGTSLGYWLEPGDTQAMRMFGLTWLPGNLNRGQLVEYYCERMGCDPFDPMFYFVFGLFKIAVIVQQIYARFKKGHTSDPRFAGLIHIVNACGHTAQQALSLNRIYDLGIKGA